MKTSSYQLKKISEKCGDPDPICVGGPAERVCDCCHLNKEKFRVSGLHHRMHSEDSESHGSCGDSQGRT